MKGEITETDEHIRRARRADECAHDDIAAVQVIDSGINGSRSVYEILKLGIFFKYTTCDIVRIHTHVGLYGNEMADPKSKSGLQNPYVIISDFRPEPNDFDFILMSENGFTPL